MMSIEELCLWYKMLDAPKRIMVMCSLLGMAQPLEIPFFCAVIKNHQRKYRSAFERSKMNSNDELQVSKLRESSLPDDLRSSILVSLPLLRYSNRACAEIFYDIINSNLQTVFSVKPGDTDKDTKEVLTLLTLAVYHPAFSFQQKMCLEDHLKKQKPDVFSLKVNEEKVLKLSTKSENHGQESSVFVPPTEMPVQNGHLPIATAPPHFHQAVRIDKIVVDGPKKSPKKKKGGPEYHLTAYWSNGAISQIYKQLWQIKQLRNKIMNICPDAQPPLPNGGSFNHHHTSKEEHLKDQLLRLNSYFEFLTHGQSSFWLINDLCQFFGGVPVQGVSSHVYPPAVSIADGPCTVPAVNGTAGGMPYSQPQFGCQEVLCQICHGPQMLPVMVSNLPPPALAPFVSVSRSTSSSSTSSQPISGSSSPEAAIICTPPETYKCNLVGELMDQLHALDSVDNHCNSGQPQSAPYTMNKSNDRKLDSSKKQPMVNGTVDSAEQTTASLDSKAAVDNETPVSDESGDRGTTGSPILQNGHSEISSKESSETSDVERGNETKSKKAKNWKKSGKTNVKVSADVEGSGIKPSSPSTQPEYPLGSSDEVLAERTTLQYSTPLVARPHHSTTIVSAQSSSRYIDSKADIGNATNTNNNYVGAGIPAMSTTVHHGPPFLPPGVGAVGAVCVPPFQPGQPQPAHTNITVLHGKRLVSMPPDPRSSNPVLPMSYMPVGPGIVTNPPPQLDNRDSVRMPMYHLPYGRGNGHVTLPHRHILNQTRPGAVPHPVVTLSIQKAPLVTVSTCHHSTAATTTTTTSHFSTLALPASQISTTSHVGEDSGQSEPGKEPGSELSSEKKSLAPVESSVQSSSQVQNGDSGLANASHITAAPTIPVPNQVTCQSCVHGGGGAHGSSYCHSPYPPPPSVVYPVVMPHAPNGLVPPAGMPGYYAQGTHVPSGILSNSYGSNMYPYTQPMYAALNPPARPYYHMVGNNVLYQQGPPGSNLGGGGIFGNGVPPVPHQPPIVREHGRNKYPRHHRNAGCYTCGALSHKAAHCPQTTVETVSGKSTYVPVPDLRPQEDSD